MAADRTNCSRDSKQKVRLDHYCLNSFLVYSYNTLFLLLNLLLIYLKIQLYCLVSDTNDWRLFITSNLFQPTFTCRGSSRLKVFVSILHVNLENMIELVASTLERHNETNLFGYWTLPFEYTYQVSSQCIATLVSLVSAPWQTLPGRSIFRCLGASWLSGGPLSSFHELGEWSFRSRAFAWGPQVSRKGKISYSQ